MSSEKLCEPDLAPSEHRNYLLAPAAQAHAVVESCHFLAGALCTRHTATQDFVYKTIAINQKLITYMQILL